MGSGGAGGAGGAERGEKIGARGRSLKEELGGVERAGSQWSPKMEQAELGEN